MGIIGKAMAIVMLPLSILIVLESLELFTLNIGFNKVFLGAILMIVLQIITLVMVKVYHGEMSIMNFVTFGVFVIPAATYLLSSLISLSTTMQQVIPLVIGVMMLIESVYALH